MLLKLKPKESLNDLFFGRNRIMIKRVINTLEKLLKLEAVKLIDFSISFLKGFNFKIEFFEQTKRNKKEE